MKFSIHVIQILLLSHQMACNNSFTLNGSKPTKLRSGVVLNKAVEPHPPDKPPSTGILDKAADAAAAFFASALDDYVAGADDDDDDEEEQGDVSIPYFAAAKLAYEQSDKSMPYQEFKSKYSADAIALVKSKQPIDVSIPYDAAAKLAYEASDESMPYENFRSKYESEAVAFVKSKQPGGDVSVPYDAAAKLAYEGSDKSLSYEDFRVKYEAEAVAFVKSKNPNYVEETSSMGYKYEPIEFEMDEATKESARQFYESVIKPISEIQAGVPKDAIKGAALVGAALGVITTKGVVATSAASLSAAYVAISQGVLGDVFRTVGGVTWDATQAAATLYQKATANEMAAGMSKELAARVMAAVDFNQKTGATTLEEEEDVEEAEAELAQVLKEAESAISAADAAIAAADESLASEEEEDDDESDKLDAEAARLEEEVRLAEEELEKAEEEARLIAEESRMEAERLEHERLQMEEEAEKERLAEVARLEEEEQLRQELLAAQEQVQLEEERQKEPEEIVDDDDDDFDQELTDAIALAQEGLEGKIVGLEEAITNESKKREWDAAGALAQELQDGRTTEFDDEVPEISQEDTTGEDYAYEYFDDETDETVEIVDDADEDEPAKNEAEEEDYEYVFDDEDGQDMEAVARAAREAVTKSEEQAEAATNTKQDQRDEWDNAMVLDEDDDDDDIEDVDPDLDGLLPDGDMDEIARAAREAVARSGGGIDDLRTSSESIAALGDDVVDELDDDGGVDDHGAAREAIAALGDEIEELDDDEEGFEFFEDEITTSGQQGSQAIPLRDWSALTVAKLREELKLRGLKTYGKKAELVQLLVDYEAEQMNDGKDKSEEEDEDSDDDLPVDFAAADLAELGRQARAAVDAYGEEEEEEETDSDDDWLNEFNEIVNLQNLGEQARAAVDAAEPSDEVLAQLEMEEPLLFDDVVPETKNYESMTVSELKDELRGKGLRVSGRKAELIERLKSA